LQKGFGRNNNNNILIILDRFYFIAQCVQCVIFYIPTLVFWNAAHWCSQLFATKNMSDDVCRMCFAVVKETIQKNRKGKM